MWLLKTILISSILGISLGTISGLTARMLGPIYAPIPFIQPKKIVLGVDNQPCCTSSQIPTVEQTIVAAQVVNGDEKIDQPTPEPSATPSPIPIQETVLEATPAAKTSPTENSNEQSENANSTQPKIGLDANLLFGLVNKHRVGLGLPEFTKDDNLCSLAQVRSAELGAEFDHGKLHSGLYNRNLPYWITENAILMRTEAEALQWWLHSPVHRHSIESDYKYSCLACTGTQCSELFTSFIPKKLN